MTKFLFRSICPICREYDDVIQWKHTNCGGRRFIDENLDLICEKCGDRTFILNSPFSCNKNNHTKEEKPDAFSIIGILSYIKNIPDLDGRTRVKMRSNLINYCQKNKLN